MKKTLLATAIAGSMIATGAQAATIYNQDGTKLDLYGNLQIAYRNIEKDVSKDGEAPDVQSREDLFDNGSTLGFAGEHVINRGLTGYFKYEFEGEADEAKDNGGLNSGDQAYMGLKGNFGDTRLGSWDPLVDDWIQDPITNNEYFDVSDSNQNIIGVNDSREGNKLQYMSPSFSGFQFAVGTQFEGDNEGVKTKTFDAKDGTSHTVKGEGDSNASFFGGLKYTAGAFSIAAVYDNLDNNDAKYTNTGEDFDAGDQYGITAQYTVDTLRVAAKLERFDSGSDLIENVNYYGLGARYGYGNGMGDIYGAYQYVDVGGDKLLDTANDGFTSGDWPNEDGESYNEVMIGATYNVSDAMYTFIEGAWYDREDDEKDGVAVGAVYLF